MGEKRNQPSQLWFNASLKAGFQGSRVTSDAGLILVRELEEGAAGGGEGRVSRWGVVPTSGLRRQPGAAGPGGGAGLDRLKSSIDQLSAAVEQEAEKRPEVLHLMTHPGVGPLTALAFVLIIGTPGRFHCGKQIGSYLGLIPCEDSSAGRQRLGHISKQGNSLLRFLLVEATQVAVRCDPEWRSQFVRLAMRRQRSIAMVAMARKLAVRLYWMWRKEWDHQQTFKFGSHAGQLGSSHGVK